VTAFVSRHTRCPGGIKDINAAGSGELRQPRSEHQPLKSRVYATHFNFDLFWDSVVQVLDPASPYVTAIRVLFEAMFLICLAILIIVVALICTWLFRSRVSVDHANRHLRRLVRGPGR
jgi:hypothetical protein